MSVKLKPSTKRPFSTTNFLNYIKTSVKAIPKSDNFLRELHRRITSSTRNFRRFTE